MNYFRILSFLVNPQSIAATYPCPCGFYGDTQKPYTCAQAMVTKYQKRISGILLDRIDIHIEVPRVDYEKLSGDRIGETSESIRVCVQTAHNIQQLRLANYMPTTNRILPVTPICASVRYSSFASYRMKVGV